LAEEVVLPGAALRRLTSGPKSAPLQARVGMLSAVGRLNG